MSEILDSIYLCSKKSISWKAEIGENERPLIWRISSTNRYLRRLIWITLNRGSLRSSMNVRWVALRKNSRRRRQRRSPSHSETWPSVWIAWPRRYWQLRISTNTGFFRENRGVLLYFYCRRKFIIFVTINPIAGNYAANLRFIENINSSLIL